MDRVRQKAIVQIAVLRGLLAEEVAAGLPDETPLQALLDSGALTPGDVTQLEHELASAPTLPPRRNDGAGAGSPRPITQDTPTEMWDDSDGWEELGEAATRDPDATPTLSPGKTQALGSTGDLASVSLTHSLHKGAEFGRYTILRFLGAGGMGQVYKAYDTTLERPVALKFLKGAEPDQVLRFFREARAQARLVHENICNVFEAGEVEGRPYIAMQYIKGEELGDMAAKVGLEQRIKLLRLVCDAVHAAHREGMIHRDIKPGNVMVERTEAGQFKPYVMDFGLVRDERDPGATASGALLGTPAYISPEQAMGEADRIDRRTDVYSLGASLYFLLVGHPPFQVDNPLVHLVKVIDEEPPPPRREDPSIPADLDTIAMKCLEKAPQMRYGSARALGEELQRYLDGDPIEARPISGLNRLYKKARKNKTLVAVSAVAAVLVLVALGIAAGTRVRAVQQARLAQQFGEDTRYVEWTMRAAHLVPLHDITGAVEDVRQHMVAIEGRMRDPIAQGPGHYALGRGYLALGDMERAREELEAAWDGGYRDPDVAFGLGLAMTRLYNEELATAQAIADAEQRAARREELREAYHDPTLEYLAASEGSDLAVPDYVLGLIALVEERYEEGLEHARLAAERSDEWFYEARVLEGDVHRAWGAARSAAGDRVGALERFERARGAYEEAARIGASDPAIHAALCSTWSSTLVELYWVGEDLTPVFAELEAAAADALAVDPGQGEVVTLLAYAQWSLARHEGDHGGDPLERLAEAAVLAARAAHMTSRGEKPDSFAYVLHGMVMLAAADHEAGHGGDPRPLQDTAIESLELAIRMDPGDASPYVKIGDAYRWRGWYEWEHGMDPLPSWDQAEGYFQQAIERDPDEATFHSDLANVHIDRGQYLDTEGEEPFLSLDRGIASLDRAVALDPNEAYTSASLGNAYSVRASMLLDRGSDPTPSLELAQQRFAEAIRLAPTWSFAHAELGWCHHLRARYAHASGEDPTDSLKRAQECLDTALQHNPESMDALHYLARGRILEARHRAQQGSSTGSLLAQAEELLGRAMELDDANENLLETHGELQELKGGVQGGTPPARN